MQKLNSLIVGLKSILYMCFHWKLSKSRLVGDGSKHGVTREAAVHGFTPNSSDAPPEAADEYDILVTTDVLGQGINLQEARTVINYDLPWNPMRVVQRNGRIDRVNSPHSDIYPDHVLPREPAGRASRARTSRPAEAHAGGPRGRE